MTLLHCIEQRQTVMNNKGLGGEEIVVQIVKDNSSQP